MKKLLATLTAGTACGGVADEYDTYRGSSGTICDPGNYT